ncbi:MAG: hypothetical protein WC340_16700 [Kiritimatiellia bacterium]
MSKILEALGKLDGNNDNHWTADGLPRIDTVKMLAGDQTLTRDSITAVSTGFNRAAALEGTAPQATAQAPQEVASKGNTEPTATVAPATVQTATTEPTEGAVEGSTEQDEHAELHEVDHEAALAHAHAELAEAQSFLAAAQDLYDEKQRLLDDAINAREDAGAGESNADAIQGYLASQRKLLEERSERGRALRDAGFTPKSLRDLLPTRSPIDQALARKTTRGGNRPGAN